MKSFSHKRPIRDSNGEIVGQKAAPEHRVTRDALGGSFGCDKHRRLVVGLIDGDVITMRPEGLQKRTGELTATAVDVYRFMLMNKARRSALEKATIAKAKKKDQRLNRQIANADRKLRAQLKKENAQ